MPLEQISTIEEPRYSILAPSDLPSEKDLVLKQDDTFALFDRFGDLDADAGAGEGLYYRGTRFLSSLKLKFAQGRPLLLSSSVRRDNVVLSADLTNPDVYFEGRIFLERGSLHIFRTQFLWHGRLYQRIQVRNFTHSSVGVSLTVEFEADFADIFEARGSKREHKGTLCEPKTADGRVVISYRGLDAVVRRTVVESSTPPQVTLPSAMHFTLRLGPGEAQSIDMTFACEISGAASPAESYDRALSKAASLAESANHLTCSISTSNEQFNAWMQRSRVDLNMLLTAEPQGVYPYGGIPWFATPFGRDGIITALEVLWTSPSIAKGVLGFLSANQATTISPEQDAEPGKILHEAREGEMAVLGEIPFRRYYGSVDSTPLYLVLAGEYYRRTGDAAFIKSIWRNIQLALNWIDQYGDSDRDGFVEYSRRSEHGLVQQGWKDSGDSVFHADGSAAQPPIALCEVQAYVYAAKLEISAVAASLGDHETAQRLMREAQDLHAKFEESFWCPEIGTYALALDGNKKRCAVRTSNAGHCLFGGIAGPDHAEAVAAGFLQDRFYSGWGIRTVASSEARYNPMSYHNGSIWPHDNALIAAGMAHYHLTESAAKVMTGLFEVSTNFDFHRLPELFCGFMRHPGKGPTSYPVACSPQAWAAGSACLLLQSSIGLSIDARKKRITLSHPVLPPFLDQVRIRALCVGDASVDLMLFRSGDAVAVTVERRTGILDVIVLN